MGYKEDIEEYAICFIVEHEEQIKKGIINNLDFEDLNEKEYNYLGDLLREREFYFSLDDAVVVIDECEELEEDKGLWEGQQPEEALIIKAIYSAQNDLIVKTDEIYNTLKEGYVNAIEKLENDKGEKINLNDKNKGEVINNIFKRWEGEREVIPLKNGSIEEKEAIEEWLRENKTVGIFGGYPLGSCYIDSRCGSGYDNNSQLANYLDLDRHTVKLIPHLKGKYTNEVEEYYKKKFSKYLKEVV